MPSSRNHGSRVYVYIYIYIHVCIYTSRDLTGHAGLIFSTASPVSGSGLFSARSVASCSHDIVPHSWHCKQHQCFVRDLPGSSQVVGGFRIGRSIVDR